jgi:hypothetical protein
MQGKLDREPIPRTKEHKQINEEDYAAHQKDREKLKQRRSKSRKHKQARINAGYGN